MVEYNLHIFLGHECSVLTATVLAEMVYMHVLYVYFGPHSCIVYCWGSPVIHLGLQVLTTNLNTLLFLIVIDNACYTHICVISFSKNALHDRNITKLFFWSTSCQNLRCRYRLFQHYRHWEDLWSLESPLWLFDVSYTLVAFSHSLVSDASLLKSLVELYSQ